jgi:hypothetical protein
MKNTKHNHSETQVVLVRKGRGKNEPFLKNDLKCSLCGSVIKKRSFSVGIEEVMVCFIFFLLGALMVCVINLFNY